MFLKMHGMGHVWAKTDSAMGMHYVRVYHDTEIMLTRFGQSHGDLNVLDLTKYLLQSSTQC